MTEHGPYRVTGDVAIYDAEGNLLRQGGVWHLCRCGGSRNKPFCDITHGLKRFEGSESADHGPIAKRRDSCAADGVMVYDDRTVCCHYGQCTSRLPAVFRADAEPCVDPEGASAPEIIGVVGGCPSGALAYARGDAAEPVEPEEPASIKATVDGPYGVRGSITVFGNDGRAYEISCAATATGCSCWKPPTTLLEGNLALNSEDNGIDVDSPATTVVGNLALRLDPRQARSQRA